MRWRFCPQGEGEGTHIQDGGSWEILINARRQGQIKSCGEFEGEGNDCQGLVEEGALELSLTKGRKD